jgi:hypothetical protein
MWKRALRALGVGVEAGVSPQCRVPLQVCCQARMGFAEPVACRQKSAGLPVARTLRATCRNQPRHQQTALATLKARLEMVSGIATLLGALPGVFDTEDMRTTFVWLEKFVRNPWSHDDANVYGGELALPARSADALTVC